LVFNVFYLYCCEIGYTLLGLLLLALTIYITLIALSYSVLYGDGVGEEERKIKMYVRLICWYACVVRGYLSLLFGNFCFH
jgi:hypothetical protein